MHSHDQLFLTASSTYGHGEFDGPEFSKPLLWPCSWYAAKKSRKAVGLPGHNYCCFTGLDRDVHGLSEGRLGVLFR